ncbi:hypothetical protein CHUAL_011779 [Chamberlinius hualienensis]
MSYSTAVVPVEKPWVAPKVSELKHVVLVLSGKGGVGKSTIAVHIALKLQAMGKKVGLLDIDLCGPSIPHMLKLSQHNIHHCNRGWVPVFTDQTQSLCVMSLGFLIKQKDEPVIWRGPKKTAMIRQFITEVAWPDLDYLIVDTPPGTSDEHVAIVENLKTYNVDGAILVTTPQAAAVNDVRREATFCKKLGITILGVVENMSGYMCPSCKECTNMFSKGGGAILANYIGAPFLGYIPLDTTLSDLAESNETSLETFTKSPISSCFDDIVKAIIQKE